MIFFQNLENVLSKGFLQTSISASVYKQRKHQLDGLICNTQSIFLLRVNFQWINYSLSLHYIHYHYRKRRSKFSELVPNPFAKRSCNKICSNQIIVCLDVLMLLICLLIVWSMCLSLSLFISFHLLSKGHTYTY